LETVHLNDNEQQAADDLRWALGAPEVRQHAGKLVAVHKRCVVGIGTDRDELVAAASAKARCPWQDVVVVVVPAADLSELPR
jgi:hypothetical protein